MIELVFALIITGIVILLLSGQMSFISKKKKEIQSISDVTDKGGYGVRFSLLIEYATPSAYFSHSPVSIECKSESAPCVRKFDQKQNIFISAKDSFVNLNGISSVQFYRDDVGVISNNLKGIYGSATTEASYSRPLDLSRQKDDVYVTWPLVDDSSKPFVIMHSQGISAVFSFDPTLASSRVSSEYLVMTGKGFDASEKDNFLNQVVVIYNDKNIRHFLVQKIIDIRSCQDDGELCGKLVPANYKLNKDHYAIKFKEIEKNDLADFPLNFESDAWRGAKDISFFPTNFVTLYDPTSSDLNAHMDVRKWSHYNHTVNIPGALMAMPVKLTAYRFIKNKDGQSFDLVSTHYGSKVPNVIELEKVHGSVMFARKLGSNQISVYVSEE